MTRAGADAEDAALAFLFGKGLKLLCRNYRCRLGEIDLVMEDRGTVVFVEVRKRSSSAFGGAGASITEAKRQKLRLAARHYFYSVGRELEARFDVILFEGRGVQEPIWLQDAF